MARIFITGSADGLGQLAARRLIALGHEVVLHGRNRDRAQHALRAVPGARTALVGDLASIEATRALARDANEAGPFQAVIHNAGVYRPGAERHETVDGLDDVFAINALAPYLLTALIEGPQRLIYLTSGLHQGGDPDLSDLQQRRRGWSGPQAYANSKLFDVVLAFAVARLLPHVLSNAVAPGWVPTIRVIQESAGLSPATPCGSCRLSGSAGRGGLNPNVDRRTGGEDADNPSLFTLTRGAVTLRCLRPQSPVAITDSPA